MKKIKRSALVLFLLFLKIVHCFFWAASSFFFLISIILPFEKQGSLITYNLTCQTGYSHLSYLEELCNMSVITQWSMEADVLGDMIPYGIPDVEPLLPKELF